MISFKRKGELIFVKVPYDMQDSVYLWIEENNVQVWPLQHGIYLKQKDAIILKLKFQL
jgi:hypothetical protein